MPTMKKPKLLFFHDISLGDIKKYERRSNVAQTGGGARDLRFPKSFVDRLAPMFPKQTSRKGVSVGEVYWEDPDGHTKIRFWRPTDVRPTERRLGKIYKIKPWRVDRREWEQARDRGEPWFYVLTMDSSGRVWARLLKGLEGEKAPVRNFIKRRLAQRSPRSKHHVQGVIDFEREEYFP